MNAKEALQISLTAKAKKDAAWDRAVAAGKRRRDKATKALWSKNKKELVALVDEMILRESTLGRRRIVQAQGEQSGLYLAKHLYPIEDLFVKYYKDKGYTVTYDHNHMILIEW